MSFMIHALGLASLGLALALNNLECVVDDDGVKVRLKAGRPSLG